MNWFLSSFLYLIFIIVILVIFLSLTGKSTGIRETCAIFILTLFELTARNATDKNSLEEKNSDEEYDEDVLLEAHEQIKYTTKMFRQNSSGDLAIIDRRWSSSLDRKLRSRSPSQDLSHNRRINNDPEYETIKIIIEDTGLFISAGIEAIIEDEVTSRFKAAQLTSWNFLSRNKASYYVSWKLSVIWFLGFIVRYFIFFPIRFVLFCVSGTLLVFFTTIVGFVPNEKLKEDLNRYIMLMCMRVASRAFSAIVNFHNTENRPTHGICVANHTSPIDVMILSCDNCYAMIGQRQNGFLGFLQRSLSRSSHHIWFERSEAKDRKQVSTKIYPIAIKYDNRLGDAFWNSHEQGYLCYLISMMTAWAMVCDVWYLPPVVRKENEDSVAFARRVQRLIAKKGGLIDLEWDGNLKRAQVPDRLKKEQKDMFYRYLARTTALCECGKKEE